tara:strand:+ start:8802 stop:9035 length:234 start_codon:yes stop_codon:yes gene_type:complete
MTAMTPVRIVETAHLAARTARSHPDAIIVLDGMLHVPSTPAGSQDYPPLTAATGTVYHCLTAMVLACQQLAMRLHRR